MLDGTDDGAVWQQRLSDDYKGSDNCAMRIVYESNVKRFDC